MPILLFFLFLTSSSLAAIKLTIGGKEAELEKATLEARLHGRFLIRDLTLKFRNEGRRVAEGDLTCPLAEGEEIVSFAMDVNGLRREGVVVPEKRGKFAYETIVRRGVDPGLIEVNEIMNEFRTRVFPIPKEGSKTVWITTAQIVDTGEVKIWPQGLGSPKNWDLTLETAGGKAGDFPRGQSGDSNSVPIGKVTWQPTPDLAYRSDQGDLHFAEKTPAKFDAERLEIWLDGATEISPSAHELLAELLARYQNAKVALRVFRESVGEPREFSLVDGRAPELLGAISKVTRLGMARPQELPWKTVEADAVIFLSDGAFATGRAGLGKTPCPLHVIDSGKGTSGWLRSAALLSGGGWHDGKELDPALGLAFSGATNPGEVMDHWIYQKPAKEVLKTPIANWPWAKMLSQKMNEHGVSREKIDAFNYEHGVMDSQSSMIVMETARQYQEFKIEPPKQDVELYRRWLALKKNKQEVRKKSRDTLVKIWQERCDALAVPVAPLGKRLMDRVAERRKQLGEIVEQNDRVTENNVAPLIKKLNAIRDLCQDGIAKEEIGGIKKHIESLREMENDLKLKAPWIEVVVGGQVRKPGTTILIYGRTLSQAVKAAGGATPYGAINRVRLYRNGRVYSYNLRLERHQAVKLYPRDLIEVPQKMMFGDVQSGDQKTGSFAEEGVIKITIEKGDDNPSKYYLDALAKVIDHDEKWKNHYQVYRAACGWRADFYLNVIEFLRGKNELAKALHVAGDLAELMPDDPEILRRAARAFRRLGDEKMSYELFARIVELLPEDGIALYDLARSEERLGDAKASAKYYWKAVKISDSYYTRGQALVILEDLNSLLQREGLNGEEFGIDPRLVRHVPVKFRAVLEWDTPNRNLDLIVRPLVGGWFSSYDPRKEISDAWWSPNIIQGFGPESCSVQGLLPGEYSLEARFNNAWREDGISTVTAGVLIYRNFGTPEETRERRALRIEEKTTGEIMKMKVTPEGWE